MTATTQHSEQDTVRVLHLTDPHLFAEHDGELRGVVTLETLSRVLDHYRSSDWTADLVIASGDLVQDDSEGAYQRIAEQIGGLGLPVLTVPGNHDVPELMADVLPSPPFQICETTELGDWMLAGINTRVAGSASGAVATSELDRLEAELAAGTAAHAMVFMHHAPVDVGSRWLDSVGMHEARAVLARLDSNPKIRVLLFGHVHQAYDAPHGGLRVIGTPSTCRQFRPASDEYAVDDRPPAYRQLEFGPNGHFETTLVWT